MNMILVFGDRSNEWKKDDPAYNRAFVEAQMKYAKDIFDTKGWLYLRQLHDMLGLDAHHIASVMGWDFVDSFEFSIEEPDENGFIRIHHNARAI